MGPVSGVAAQRTARPDEVSIAATPCADSAMTFGLPVKNGVIRSAVASSTNRSATGSGARSPAMKSEFSPPQPKVSATSTGRTTTRRTEVTLRRGAGGGSHARGAQRDAAAARVDRLYLFDGDRAESQAKETAAHEQRGRLGLPSEQDVVDDAELLAALLHAEALAVAKPVR